MTLNGKVFEGVPEFVQVVESGSFVGAAASLGRSKSYISKAVTGLEERLGTRLLTRTTRSVLLTVEGRAYYERAREFVELAEAAEDNLKSVQDHPRGLLKVTMPLSFGLGSFAELLPEFVSRYADVQLQIDLRDARGDFIAEGFDVAVIVGAAPDSALISRKLSSSRGLVVASPTYWEKRGRPGHPDDLKAHDCFGFSGKADPEVWQFSDPNGRPVIVHLALKGLFNNAELEVAMAVAGLGVTRVPAFSCLKEIAGGELEPVLEDFEVPPLVIQALYPHRTHMPAKLRVFLDFFATRLR